ncbi:c-type cytochrome [Bizionia paragorgiae]|uniref:c-type cytochrome n=1 Tax=Bizionia paragorgiae TaxID=283786 RepID=UPI003A908537
MISTAKNRKTFGGFILGTLLVLAITCSNPMYGQANFDKTKSTQSNIPDSIKVILKRNQCIACHREKDPLVGPSFEQIAKKEYSSQQLLKLIRTPQTSNWPGYPPMPPVKSITEEEVNNLAIWIMTLNKS